MRIVYTLILSYFLTCSFSVEATENTEPDTPLTLTQHFDIPAQSLTKALIELAIQSKISIILSQTELKALRSNHLIGTYSPIQALDIILFGSPLSYDINIENQAIIFRAGTSTHLAFNANRSINAKKFDPREEEVIVTASGYRTPLYKAPAIATVITAVEIEQFGVNNLSEALEMVAGLHISLSALNRLDYVYSIRGIHTGFNPHVLLLMDGVPIQFSFQGSKPVQFRLPVSNIHQIEIIRGPGSAIYGADAYSGVINVITKDYSSAQNFNMGVRMGSFDTQDIWLQGKASYLGWETTYGFTYQHSDGDKTRTIHSDQQTILDNALSSNASLAPGPLSTQYEVFDSHLKFDNHKWTVNLWSWSSHNSGLGAGAAQALDHKGKDDTDLFLIDVNYQIGDAQENWTNDFRATYQHYDTRSQLNLFPPGATLPIGSDGNVNPVEPEGLVQFSDGFIGNPGGKAEDSSVELTSLYSGWNSHTWRIAIGAKNQRIKNRETKNFGPGVIDGSQPVISGNLKNLRGSEFIFLKDVSRFNKYLSLQDEWNITQEWHLTTGVRFDHYSDFGSTNNPRIALVWVPNEKISAKFLSGKAYRAPSFTEQFNQNNPVAIGNANLAPEEIETHEISLTINTEQNLRSTISLFTYRAQGLIELLPDSGKTTRTAQNSRNQDGEGFEWETHWKANSRLQVKTSFSFQNATDRKLGNKIADAPGRQFSLNLHWQPTNAIWLSMGLNHVADRSRSSTDTRKKIADYTVIDFTAKYRNIMPNIDLSAGVRNASKEDAREPSNGVIPGDYPLESRSFWLEFAYNFR